MNKEFLMRRLFACLAMVFTATAALAVSPIPPFTTWPCNPSAPPGDPTACTTIDKNDCFSYRTYTVNEALQHRIGDGRSPRSNAKPAAPYGVCSGFNQWCSIAPQINSAKYDIIVHPDGGRDVLFDIEYDFPNSYCQVYDDGPPCNASVFPPKHVIEVPPVRLMLVSASTGNVIRSVPAVFEAGIWKPRVSLGCDAANSSFRVVAMAGGGVSGCTAPTTEVTVAVSAPASEPGTCKADKWCPDCNGFPAPAAGKPVALGSGDVTVTEPLFSINQIPLPLSFTLTYHSQRYVYPHLVDSPLGLGWSHTFSDTIRRVDARGTVLYRVDGEGHELHYEGRPNGPWYVVSPGELRGRQAITLQDGSYVIRELDGKTTTYSGATGRWQATTDRWGNSITGLFDSNGYLIGLRDPVGREITFTHVAGTITSIAMPTGETWRFDHNGFSLMAIFDPIHTGTTAWKTYEYAPDSKGIARLLSAVRDESGALLEGHNYDAQERGTTSYSEGGREMVTIAYVAEGRTKVTTDIDATLAQQSEYTMRYKGGRWLPTKIVGSCASCGASSNEQLFTLDSNNRVTSRTDGGGHVARLTYDFYGNVTSRTEASATAKSRTTSYFFEYPTWPTFVTRITEMSAAKPGAVKTTSFGWSPGETVLTRTQSGWSLPSDSRPTTYISTTTFDARHRPLISDGPRTEVADVSSGDYYPEDDPDVARRGRRRSSTDAIGLSTSYDNYDIYGTPRRVVDANGVVVTSTTDARGRTTGSTNHAIGGDANEASDYTSTMTYDGRDRLTQTTNPRGNATRYEYEDGTNRRTGIVRVDTGGNEFERHHVTYTSVGGKASEEEQRCAVPAPSCASWITRRSTGYAYDKHNRLTELRHAAPAGAKTVYSYDPDGMLTAVQDENHSTPNTRYTYDAYDRLVAVTQTLASAPGGVSITRYDYDVMNNLVSVTDPNGNVTRYEYDDFGRMTRQVSPVTGTTIYRYDSAGNLAFSVDARGAMTTRTHDALGRVLISTVSLEADVETVSYTYDIAAIPGNYGNGRLAAMADPSGYTRYDYDRRGLIRRETKGILDDTFVTEFHYDANGNRSGLTYPSGRKLMYSFDGADRPRALSGTFGSVTTQYIANAQYEPFGPATVFSYGNGSLERRATYDSRYRIAGLDVIADGAPLASYRYASDAVGNVTAITDALDPRYSRAFGYDDLNRLTSSTTGSALWGSATWTYDPMGNRLTETVAQRASSYTYVGTTSKLASATENGRTRSVDYDAAGNERTVGGAPFTYTPRNSLHAADGIRYVYDGSGTRVAQVGLSIAPIITEQPRSQSVCPGVSVTLTVRGSGATSIEWQLSADGTSWSPISGESASVLTVSAATTAYYRAVISNAAASTTSEIAAVTPATLTMEPTSGIIYGDVNRDGAINAADANLLRAVLAEKEQLPVLAVADLNGDGRVDALDLALLTAYGSGTITCLPQFATNAIPSVSDAPSSAIAALTSAAPQTPDHPTQYFFYTPEKNLLSNTSITAGGGTRQFASDYIWFAGVPVAEEDLTSAVSTLYTFTDHLGTPFLQTATSGTVTWRAEYEPYGAIWTSRTGAAVAQRLRLPGQEYDEQRPETAYNIFRWYRAGWGRYTEADPLGEREDTHVFRYAANNPVLVFDSLGLAAEVVCKDITTKGQPVKGLLHCRVRVTCPDCDGNVLDTTFGMEYVGEPGKKYGMTEWPFPVGLQDYYVRGPVSHPGMTECDFYKCVRAYNKVFGKGYTGAASKYVPAYKATGSNSNTYARKLIEQCGGIAGTPAGAAGWDK
ncbi:MAG TPA: RHS repeat-associated core domain-containing protein [Thermoanaerobaculia bacterium]|jgi:RHS repeat-associated protein